MSNKGTPNPTQIWFPVADYVVDSQSIKSMSASANFTTAEGDKTKSFAIDPQCVADIEQAQQEERGQLQDEYKMDDAKFRVGAYFATGYLKAGSGEKVGQSQKTDMVGHLEG